MLGNTRIDALVPPTRNDNLLGGREPLQVTLCQGRTAWRRDREDGTLGNDIVNGVTPHVGAHHHARTATAGRIINRQVFASCPVPQIVDLDVEDARVARLSH